jgi:hypothetical protein
MIPAQMNEFINFNQRGFLLPDGCKDLIDVMAPQKKAALPAEGLQDIQRYVARLLNSTAQMRILSIRSSEPLAVVVMWCTAEFFSATVYTVAAREKVIRQIFSDGGIPLVTEHPFLGSKFFSRALCYSFPTVENQVVRLLYDYLFSGCGLEPDAKLKFSFRKKAGAAK